MKFVCGLVLLVALTYSNEAAPASRQSQGITVQDPMRKISDEAVRKRRAINTLQALARQKRGLFDGGFGNMFGNMGNLGDIMGMVNGMGNAMGGVNDLLDNLNDNQEDDTKKKGGNSLGDLLGNLDISGIMNSLGIGGIDDVVGMIGGNNVDDTIPSISILDGNGEDEVMTPIGEEYYEQEEDYYPIEEGYDEYWSNLDIYTEDIINFSDHFNFTGPTYSEMRKLTALTKLAALGRMAGVFPQEASWDPTDYENVYPYPEEYGNDFAADMESDFATEESAAGMDIVDSGEKETDSDSVSMDDSKTSPKTAANWRKKRSPRMNTRSMGEPQQDMQMCICL